MFPFPKRKEVSMNLTPVRCSRSVLALLVGLAFWGRHAVFAVAQETGTIKGTISTEGVRDSANVLVHIEKYDGKVEAPKKNAEMDQQKLTFIPFLLPVVKGTTVDFLNTDPLLHNIFWKAGEGYAARNLGTWGKGAKRNFTFANEGHVTLLCNVHADMEAHIVVLQNPYFAVTDKGGNYEIKDVPAGSYKLKTWYSRPTKLKSQTKDVTVQAGKSATVDFSLSPRSQ
jgi:plastocyanin